MDERGYLVKAQEAQVVADAMAEGPERQLWENIATQYRKLARNFAAIRQGEERSAKGG